MGFTQPAECLACLSPADGGILTPDCVNTGWLLNSLVLEWWRAKVPQLAVLTISCPLFPDIQARWQRPVHEPQAGAGGGAVRLPVYAETLG